MDAVNDIKRIFNQKWPRSYNNKASNKTKRLLEEQEVWKLKLAEHKVTQGDRSCGYKSGLTTENNLHKNDMSFLD